MNKLLALGLLLTLGCAACGSNGGGGDGALPDGPPAEAGPDLDAGPDQTVDGPPPCGTGEGALPAGAQEILWDSNTILSHIRAQEWKIIIDGYNYDLAKVPIHEAVRFDLSHPAKVVGFAIKWANVPAGADPTDLLTAGLYPDFGHNGFDFWAKDPYWEGTRCVKDHKEGEWLTYVLPTPVEIDQPGLVYVAHRSEDAQSPVFAFDDNPPPENKCDKFADCHSGINLPTAPGGYYNGVSFPFPYNFLVRLYVVYTAQLKPEDRMFQKVSSGPTGGHVSWGDYDNDGWDDALVAGKLYRNDKGTLVDATDQAGLTGITATGGVWGDYDNDGCLDLFLFNESHTKADVLLKSTCSGGFTDVTGQAGIVDQQSYNNCGDPKNIRSPTAAAAWIDLDADGFLDLYLANFICWDPGTFYVDTVFRNKGDGTFEEWSEQKGFSSAATPSRCTAPADLDNDGDVDLFVGNYRLLPNLLFVNNGNGTVTEKATAAGVAGVPYPLSGVTYYGHTIGAAWGDLDNDGDLDLVAANLAHPRFYHFSNKTQLLLNDGSGTFTDAAGDWTTTLSPSGLVYRETHSVPLLADFDQDGNLDLAITEVYDGRPTDFYWGKGDGTFELDVYTTGITTTNGWGIAASDYDNDGDQDVFATDLFTNTLSAGKKGHWLQLRVVGQGSSNWAGIGATVRVTAGGKTYLRQVPGGSGKGGQDSMYLHFGLGSATSVSSIQVTFPGKKTVSYAGPFAADQRIWLYADGTTHSGWGPKP